MLAQIKENQNKTLKPSISSLENNLYNKSHVTQVLIEPHYCPCIEFFAEILDKNSVLLDINENYVKQSYRNRCYILSSQQIDKLILPVVNPHSKTKIKDIELDNSSNTLNKHWKSIYTSYGKAPFFMYYEEGLYKIFSSKYKFLFDLNLELLNYFLTIINIKKEIKFTLKYENPLYIKNNKETILDLRNKVCTNKNFKLKFEKYFQVFGQKFQPNLSILDLLMSEGPNSLEILKKTKK